MLQKEFRKDDLRRILIWSLLCVAALILIVAGFFSFQRTFLRFSMDFYYPFLKGARDAENYAAKRLLMTKSRAELADAVERLQMENARLAVLAARTTELEAETAEQRGLLGMRAPEAFTPVFAEVLLRDPANWSFRFTIDRGSDDGIAPGDVVTTYYVPGPNAEPTIAVVGRVAETSRKSAVVMTILDPECSLSVRMAESGMHGTLSGIGDRKAARVSRLPTDGLYAIGEMALTSGFSPRTPRGFCVGYLNPASPGDSQAAKISDSGQYAEASLRPAAPLDRLRAVMVLSRRPPQ